MYPITIETFPGAVLAALPHHGSYQEIGPVFTRAFMLAASRGLARPEAIGFGVYFDDPEQVPPASCARWQAYRSRPTPSWATNWNASRSPPSAARC